MLKDEIEKANNEAVERMMEAQAIWVDIAEARKVIPGFKEYMLTHAGPPITWSQASGPLRGALIGAVLYEGWANSVDEAVKMLERGEIILKPNHELNAVGPMAGVISPSMPVIVVKDPKYGNTAYSNLNEGIGKVLRYGAYDKSVLDRLKWMHDEFFPVLKATIDTAVKEKGGIDLKTIISQALTMGDECHNRHVAATSLFINEVIEYMIKADIPKDQLLRVLNFMRNNTFTFLNFAMAAAKVFTLAGHNIKYSTIVTVMSRNGTEVGIWVSGLGNRWFTAPAPIPRGIFFPGYSQEDANPDIGDSAITETAGFGGFAMAASPAIISWVGGTVDYAIEVTNKMYQITHTKHKYFRIPYLSFQGTPVGIDIRKVLKTGIEPTLNTGIAHKEAGIGQIGAGIVQIPIEAFKKALVAYAEYYGI
ncbi:DUF1116 domain-containing protein [Vulcanisaeta thermophila]|uniref:DUF1116 domain-containing protein n=1 Tax=Vulcanisaeta thermophila TaxID=867917 RepID=UPI000852F444|nr:DUF1116 domain-containing protein [Vulcanisaeta thermophila]